MKIRVPSKDHDIYGNGKYAHNEGYSGYVFSFRRFIRYPVKQYGTYHSNNRQDFGDIPIANSFNRNHFSLPSMWTTGQGNPAARLVK